jgi:F0F1-type ATP synthase delta subunit
MQSIDINKSAAQMDPKLKEAILKLAGSGRKPVVVTTAYSLTEAEKDMLLEKLNLSNEEYQIDNVVDKKILGGMIVQYGSLYLDYSIEGRLKEIRESLLR